MVGKLPVGILRIGISGCHAVDHLLGYRAQPVLDFRNVLFGAAVVVFAYTFNQCAGADEVVPAAVFAKKFACAFFKNEIERNI